MALIGHALALIGRAQKPRLILAQKASLSLSSISCQPASFETGSKGNIDPVTNIVIAKTSSNYKFNQEREYSKASHVAIFRAIANSTKGELLP